MLEEFKLLEKYGFTLLPYGVVKNEKEALALADKLRYPVVVKIVSSQVSHKTEVGGVKTNIKNAAGLKVAIADMSTTMKEHNLKFEGFLVQKMARKGIELIIGGKKDPQFGQMIILGLGGIYVEVFRDISARLCPINERDVEEMVDELKSHPLLEGVRGQKGIDINSLKKIMLKASNFIIKEDLKELDLNPVIFDDKGCDLVDVRFRK
jgi:acetyltransferase